MNNKGVINRFLSNNVVLMVLSLLIAFIIWFVINANAQTESNVTISDIPINFELSQEAVEDGLQVFSLEKTASVEVTGNRITVGSLTASDIQVYSLDTNAIMIPDEYTLELDAKKVGVKTNYKFVSSISPPSVTVCVDRFMEKTFTITDEVLCKVEKENYYGNVAFSDSSVTVSGPESEVSSIDRVVVKGILDASDGNSKKSTFELLYYNGEGEEVEIVYSETDRDRIEVTLTPLPIREVTLDVELVNAPKNYPAISINPRKINIAAEQAVLDSITDNKVIIGKLDFSQLSNSSHTFNYGITLPSGCKNLSDSSSAKVDIDLSGYETKKVTVSNFTAADANPDKYNVVYNTTRLEVVVCGPSELVKNINSAQVIPQVDFTSKLDDIDKESVSLELPVTFKFTEDYQNCWVYGTYTVSVNVTKK
ncbi:MAG: hypothetical protein IJ433_08560 [Ruminococcus sp.]|nr:hypothetical protein [Ruminococcus sp.]